MSKKGIWIPVEIMNDMKLDWPNKALLSEIYSLVKLKNGCIASNTHFAKLLGVQKSAASKRITKLKNLGYIKCKNETEDRVCIGRIITKNRSLGNNTVVPKKQMGSSGRIKDVVPPELDTSSVENPINTITNSVLKVQLPIHTGPKTVDSNSNPKSYKSQYQTTKETYEKLKAFLSTATSLGEEIFKYADRRKFDLLVAKIGEPAFERIKHSMVNYIESGKQLNML